VRSPDINQAPGASYYMPPLFVSIVEYFLHLNPCDLTITHYEHVIVVLLVHTLLLVLLLVVLVAMVAGIVAVIIQYPQQ